MSFAMSSYYCISRCFKGIPFSISCHHQCPKVFPACHYLKFFYHTLSASSSVALPYTTAGGELQLLFISAAQQPNILQSSEPLTWPFPTAVVAAIISHCSLPSPHALSSLWAPCVNSFLWCALMYSILVGR